MKINHKKEILELNKKIDILQREINNLKQIFKPDIFKDSWILKNCHRNILNNWLNSQNKIFSTKLLFSLSSHGHNMNTLKQLINNKGPTLSLFLLENETIIGGYASISWGAFEDWGKNNNAFIFNLTSNTKFDIKYNKDAIYYAPNNALYSGHFGYEEHANYDLNKLCVHRVGGGGNYNNGEKILSQDYRSLKPKEIEVYQINLH